MTNDDLAPILTEAVATLKAAELESSALRESLPGLLVERKEYEKGQRRIMRVVLGLGALLLVVLLYLVPLASKNAENLRIVKDVTGEEAQAESDARLAGLICLLLNHENGLHGAGPEPGCTSPTPPTTTPDEGS